MKPIFVLALLLAACSPQADEPGLAPGTFAGMGRDQLCIAGGAGALQAGLIVYGTGDVNCSASGKLQKADRTWMLVPKGEGDCQISLEAEGNIVRIGRLPEACSYYCGPGATMAGKAFKRDLKASPARDFAGDPLC